MPSSAFVVSMGIVSQRSPVNSSSSPPAAYPCSTIKIANSCSCCCRQRVVRCCRVASRRAVPRLGQVHRVLRAKSRGATRGAGSRAYKEAKASKQNNSSSNAEGQLESKRKSGHGSQSKCSTTKGLGRAVPSSHVVN